MRQNFLRMIGTFVATLASLLLSLSGMAAASSAKIIYSFAGGADGAYPYSDLILDAGGNLYGTTATGGSYNGGTVFELIRTQHGWTHQVLYGFGSYQNDGGGPQAGLVFDTSGNLYGTTVGGGAYQGGTVFKLAANGHGGWTESVLFSFGSHDGDGYYPATNLVFDNQGNLYGTTKWGGGGTRFNCGWNGCGTVFEVTPNLDGTWTENVYAFQGSPQDAAVPVTPIFLDSAGNLYGATSYGGTETCDGIDPQNYGDNGCGAIYQLTPNSGGGWTETLLYNFHRFQGTGRSPAGGFLFDTSDRILGTSILGGDGDGAFFQLDRTKRGWEQTVLYRFYGNPDGQNPVGRIAVGPKGNLFGATAGGGTTRGGTVFELKPTGHGWKERVLLDATATAYAPLAGPVVDFQGRVYGTFSDGGNGINFGAVYEIIP